MKINLGLRPLLLGLALFTSAAVAHAQGSPLALNSSQNVFHLSAAGQVEVVQDTLMLSLVATREGSEAAGVQAELRKALDSALAEVKKSAQAGDMNVSTGTFSVNPRYGKEGKINGWQGRAELILEGRDFPRITQAAARATSMPIGNIAFGLSREQRAKVQTEAQVQAIERFKARAAEITKAFGFAGYGLREVTVDASDSGFPGPRPMAMEARAFSKSADAAPVAVEPGKSLVQVTVSGSVQAR
ncbi:SIMPL domain-containing protein [Ottowia thiooxydans]|uniref:SIMPL domain-containing protein n=1 Tax=Ottowia thiooxydans TaxID=219182 RepID=UPI0004032FDB|nr:SIMPL domain-containing protein [Ottowia thiooxydans]